MVLVNILLSMLTLWGCLSENQMVAYYKINRSDMDSIKEISKEFYETYHFEFASFRELSVGIRLSVHDKNPYKGTGEYYNPETLKPIHFDERDTTICESCTFEERERYKDLLADSRLKDILCLYTKIKPVAIEITAEGVFFALGSPLKHPNKTEVEGGILMPFGDNFNRNLVVKKIDENAYLYDTVVQ
jgi:hypothetical protein